MNKGSTSSSRVIVALDYSSAKNALEFVDRVNPDSCRLKIGKELFTREGPGLVRKICNLGFDVFLDLKYHDIPNTVARACEAAADLGVWMLNVHAFGGMEMMEAARRALEPLDQRPVLIAVTVLTSMEAASLRHIGIEATPEQQVMRLARLAKSAGLDGVVCSPCESTLLRQELGDEFILVTPGVRPPGSSADDQKRVMTPLEAVTAGSDYLVMGRPITQAEDSLAALEKINQGLSKASV